MVHFIKLLSNFRGSTSENFSLIENTSIGFSWILDPLSCCSLLVHLRYLIGISSTIPCSSSTTCIKFVLSTNFRYISLSQANQSVFKYINSLLYFSFSFSMSFMNTLILCLNNASLSRFSCFFWCSEKHRLQYSANSSWNLLTWTSIAALVDSNIFQSSFSISSLCLFNGQVFGIVLLIALLIFGTLRSL